MAKAKQQLDPSFGNVCVSQLSQRWRAGGRPPASQSVTILDQDKDMQVRDETLRKRGGDR